MESGSTLFNSKSWYKFVSEQAVKDEKLQGYLKEYMAAHAKVTKRVAELAEASPDVDVKFNRVGDGPLSGGMLKQIQDYHAAHGRNVSMDELRKEAQASGFDIANVA